MIPNLIHDAIWLVPVLLIASLVTAVTVLILGATGSAPFVFTIF